MNWRDFLGAQSDKPFSDAAERQKIRAAVDVVEQGQERKAVRSRFYLAARRFLVWLGGSVALLIGVSQLPEALEKVVKFFKGGP